MLDYLHALADLRPEERDVHALAREVVDAELLPRVAAWWDEGHLPREIATRLGELGFLGANLPQAVGGAGASHTAYGLICYELERSDSGLRSFVSVQSSLVMYPIFAFGSEEQQRRYLGELARGRMIGCFGLTESDGGSDPGAMRTRLRRDGSSYRLEGSKMWITNGSIADVALVWAKDDEGIVRGVLVPTDAPGFCARSIEHKQSLRASVTSEIIFENIHVPEEAVLPKASGLRAPLSCLTQARYGIVWGAMGALESVYTSALEFSRTRMTFGKPLAARQLVQDKLVRMVSAHTAGLLMARRLGELKDAGELGYAQVSLAKRNNVRAALEGARLAREILGANGITTEYPVIRHMLNLETVDTYEGTFDIHTLIVGRDLTGEQALE